jgi:predicted GNAT superfamily acetyltransferase
LEICRATEIDLDGILELQAANQPERGGALSASLPRSRIATMMRAMPLIVARCGGHITGFLMTSTREMNADVPIIRAMLAAYPGAPDAYVYGPICVSAEERGKGLAQAMLAELQRLVPGREGILFIRRDNSVSLRAHAKMGMHEVAGFAFNGNDYVALSYVATTDNPLQPTAPNVGAGGER